MLEVPQEHDLPVAFLEKLHRGGKPPLQFMPGGGGGRRKLAVGDLPAKVGLRLVAFGVGHHQRHLAIDAPGGRHAMAAMGIDQPIAGHVPEPELKRHRSVGEVLAQPPVGLDHHILHDIAGIDPPLHAPIHATIDHPLDRLAVPLKKAVHGVAIPLPHAVEQHERGLAVGKASRRIRSRRSISHYCSVRDSDAILRDGRAPGGIQPPNDPENDILPRPPPPAFNHSMHHPFAQQRTFRVGKYVFADDTLLAVSRPQRGPSQLLTVAQLLTEFPTAARAVTVDAATRLPEFHYHAWSDTGNISGWHPQTLPARDLPATVVLVIPQGRVVGRTGTIHVPAADACLQEFEWPPRDTDGFRRHLPFGRLNPRFWKHAALNAWRERLVPSVRECPGRVAVLNATGSHNFFHWTAEVLPRLWTLLRSGERADWYVVDGYARWQRESLTALGVSLDQVIQPHATLHLEADELLVPLLQLTQAIRPLAAALATGLGVAEPGSATRSIFIERSRSRLVHNADAFAGWRRQHGFEDQQLEGLPLAQQVKLFREAAIVMAAHGAGLSHIIHCRPGTLVIELMPRGVNRLCYPALSHVNGLRHVMIEATRSGWHQDMVVPIKTLDEALVKGHHPEPG